MKKILYSVLMLAMAAFTFTSCEDVPMPYEWPGNGSSDDSGETSDEYINETFASSFGSFTLTEIEGTPWKISYSTATATGYDNTSKTTTASKSYLVSKEIDLSNTEKAYLEFEYIYRYGNRTGAEDKVLITSNYTGDPTTTNWTDITGTLTEGADWSTFSKYSKNIPSAFIGQSKVVVAFYYACTSNSSTWEVKNVVLANGEVTESESDSGDKDDSGDKGDTTTGEAKGSGTAADPYNVAAMLQLADSYDDSKTYYVEGIVSKVSKFNDTYGSLNYYISDDGTDSNSFYIYSGLGLNSAKFTSTDDLAVGSKVVVCGKCTVYSGTFEFQYNSYIVSLNGQGSTDSGDDKGDTGSSDGVSISGTTVTLTNAGVTAGSESVKLTVDDLGLADKSDAAGTYSFSDGTTLTIAQGDGTNAPKYYAASKGFRIYAANTLTFSASKKIAKIVMTCDNYNSKDQVGNSTATVAFDGTTATYCNYNNGQTSGGTQLRVQTITITYAE